MSAGFTRSVIQQYQKISKIVTYVPCDNTRRTQRNPVDNMTPLTCVVSSVVRDKVTGRSFFLIWEISRLREGAVSCKNVTCRLPLCF